MKLMTKELAKKIPKIGYTEMMPATAIKVHAKYFHIRSGWEWYVTEYDGHDLFFGYVKGMEDEIGYFSLSELESIRDSIGIAVERDQYFPDDVYLSDVMEDE